MTLAARRPATPHAHDLVIERRVTGLMHVLTIRGELDATTAGQVHVRLGDELQSRPGVLVVDLSQLAFLDVRGARAIGDAVCAARASGVPIALVGLSPLARCVASVVGLTLCGLNHRTLAEALQQLGLFGVYLPKPVLAGP